MTDDGKTYILYIAYGIKELQEFTSKQFFKDKKATISVERWFNTIETDKFKILAISVTNSLLGFISCQFFDYVCDDSKPERTLTKNEKLFYDFTLLEAKSKCDENTKGMSTKELLELIKNL